MGKFVQGSINKIPKFNWNNYSYNNETYDSVKLKESTILYTEKNRHELTVRDVIKSLADNNPGIYIFYDEDEYIGFNGFAEDFIDDCGDLDLDINLNYFTISSDLKSVFVCSENLETK